MRATIGARDCRRCRIRGLSVPYVSSLELLQLIFGTVAMKSVWTCVSPFFLFSQIVGDSSQFFVDIGFRPRNGVESRCDFFLVDLHCWTSF